MKRYLLSFTAATTALSLAACGTKTEPTAEPVETSLENVVEAPVAPVVAPGQAFANTAASSDAFEIATSNLALEKAQSRTIKTFAQQMVKAHTESTAKLKAAAGSASPAITPDATLTPAQQGKLTALEGKSGAEFDQAYATEQVAAHQAALDALRSYSASADVPALGAFATAMAPVVAAHLNMAKSLKP
ncbi:hypothetical protein ACFB49_06200 [Sphingomonas sp. DBB INV C78]|uniref:DUF4142 domain-containing protein n=1 Tax=Sphingomonas sp. DBB INV C78 TaxID=3349434 RepID=UPI0036D2375F